MAKQTFTTGQVLTAAQMTSLQQTAMGGGAATAKTASYTLVAADAGTTVAMNAAGATTITVNTGLFAAGDTVFIQNLGAGACTVTAGTATVATAGSLILPQNDAGILYFTSASAAIFYDYIQAGAVSPLTTKGDLYTFSTSDARLGVGANNTVLTADSAEATGLKWAAPAAGGGMTVLASGNMPTGGTVLDLTSISGSYNHLQLVMRNLRFNGAYGMDIRVNNKTTGIYQRTMITSAGATFNNETGNADTGVLTQGFTMTNGAEPATIIVDILDYTNTTAYKIINTTNYSETHDNTGVFQRTQNFSGVRTTEAIDRITTVNASSQVTDGTYTLYGIK